MNKFDKWLIGIIIFSGLLLIALVTFGYEIQYILKNDSNWDVKIDNVEYQFIWYGEEMKVTGTDGTCYWVYGEGEIRNCITNN